MKTIFQTPIKMSILMLASWITLIPIEVMAGPPGNNFEFLREKYGIDLYYRWMTMPEGNRVRQMKAVLEINGTTADVISLLKDESKAVGWIPSAVQFRNLTQINGPTWMCYIKFSVPWPFADQDCILEYTAVQNSDSSAVIVFRSHENYLSPVEGVSRMKDIVGSFVIQSMPSGKSRLECYFLSTKASKIPRWVTEPIITGSILNLMDALRGELSHC